MCGIAGFISSQGKKEELIAKMMRIISHRGPDGEGAIILRQFSSEPIIFGDIHCNEAIKSDGVPPYEPQYPVSALTGENCVMALGHRRLSIIELSLLGHQPMCYNNGRYWIVYNGEIYNYLELKVELESLGHRFISSSDTEVILAAYSEWGEGFLHRLNGMWAISIYDSKNQTVFLARDRFGVKPLYYSCGQDGTFYFASEIKQFTVVPDWVAQLNIERAVDFLQYGVTDHTAETLFRNVFQVRGGHSLHIDIEQFKLHGNAVIKEAKWYDIPANDYQGTFEDAQKKFRELFEDAVRIRLRADVSVGTGLSGGLDSSSIVCEVNKQLRMQHSQNKQNSFSACSNDKRFDERTFIDIVANATGVQPHFVYTEFQSFVSQFDSIIWHQDEPINGASIWAQAAVFDLVKTTPVKVTLDGQGADEILGGYHVFFAFYLFSLFKKFKIGSFLKELRALKNRFGYSYAMSIKNMIRVVIIKKEDNKACISKSILREIPNKERKLFSERNLSLKKASMNQLLFNGFPSQLHWADRNSMAYSIESRMPFLDYRLVELVINCPDSYKIKKGVTKFLLRSALADILPTAITNRVDKKGFVTPEEAWVCETAGDFFKQEIKKAVEYSKGVLDESVIKKASDIITRQQPYDPIIWRWISFGRWMKIFSVDV